MKEITVVKYQPSDFIGIVGSGTDTYATAHYEHGPAVTFMVDGKVAACGGYAMPWEGTAEMWVAISQEFKHCPAVVVGIKRQMLEWIDDKNLTRVQATVKSDWSVGRRFLEWLGMDYEGTLRKLGPNGIDQCVYARVR
jgi:hypothetical protein